MVLRARYFLDAWEAFLGRAGYSRTHYYLSREAADIARIVIEGFLALVYIHRDHVSDLIALLPWFHSSEACEHVFGEARRIVKDFTMLDFIYMIPNLRIKLREAILHATSSDPKARAAGYSHTYFDNTGVDMMTLSTYPTDDEIKDAAEHAAQEADSLVALLGIVPSQLRRPKSNAVPTLPGISVWFPNTDSDIAYDDNEELDYADDDSISEAQQLQSLLDAEEDCSVFRTRKQDQELLNLTCAALAVTADEATKVNSMTKLHDEEMEELLAGEYSQVRDVVNNLPALKIQETAKPLGRGMVTFESLDFNMLIKMRREHQTRQAALGVRTKQTSDAGDGKAEKPSIRRQVIRKFEEALKEVQDERAVGTGSERVIRWRHSAPGGRDGEIEGEHEGLLPAGNTANAAVAAAAVAKTAATRRKNVFTTARVPCLQDILDARVTTFRPLQVHDYGIIYTDNGLRVGQVIVVYSKTGGKNGKHASVTDSSMISAVSYVGLQVFEFAYAREFRAIPEMTASLQTKQFVLLPSICFLYLLGSKISLTAMGLELDADDMARFRELEKGAEKLKEAMKLFKKRSKE
ncbi:hypothetical protein LshimejAT787_0408220 [Lyophyllum shimeji]|uniref:Uncharacterized protein n=1 Tax=Lyophyllum shimeji TaxID=47721 RepID=A0A9P3PM08_LYOSH|nr:hypothetical protein LshimejAT787_0408220 [Lyophyllum shimeji]